MMRNAVCWCVGTWYPSNAWPVRAGAQLAGTLLVEPSTPVAIAVSGIVPAVTLSRSLRVRVIGMLSTVILFAQVTIAAYACPAMTRTVDAGTQDMAGMPCAEMMGADVALDPEQPLLCMQHCQFGSTSQVVDPASPVFVPATALPALFTVSVDEGRDTVLRSWSEDDRLRDRPPPLAHSIAHCCYRI